MTEMSGSSEEFTFEVIEETEVISALKVHNALVLNPFEWDDDVTEGD